jgi:hypothetical protein
LNVAGIFGLCFDLDGGGCLELGSQFIKFGREAQARKLPAESLSVVEMKNGRIRLVDADGQEEWLTVQDGKHGPLLGKLIEKGLPKNDLNAIMETEIAYDVQRVEEVLAQQPPPRNRWEFFEKIPGHRAFLWKTGDYVKDMARDPFGINRISKSRWVDEAARIVKQVDALERSGNSPDPLSTVSAFQLHAHRAAFDSAEIIASTSQFETIDCGFRYALDPDWSPVQGYQRISEKTG